MDGGEVHKGKVVADWSIRAMNGKGHVREKEAEGNGERDLAGD